MGDQKGKDDTGKIYGYCRVSTPSQNIERQVRNISREYPTAIFFKEYFTGMAESSKRKEWSKLIRIVKAGDTIVFDSVSRMSRNSKEGVDDYFSLYEKGVHLIFLKESHINTEVYRKAISTSLPTTGTRSDILLEAITKFLHTLARDQIEQAFRESEKEVLTLRKRTIEGMETAKQAGKKIGRPNGRTVITKKSVKAKELILKLSKDFNGTLSDIDAIELIQISRNSYYKYKRELLEQARQKQIDDYEHLQENQLGELLHDNNG